jgi:hypothetical protein
LWLFGHGVDGWSIHPTEGKARPGKLVGALILSCSVAKRAGFQTGDVAGLGEELGGRGKEMR